MDERQTAAYRQPRYIRLFVRVLLVQVLTLTLLWILQSSFGRT